MAKLLNSKNNIITRLLVNNLTRNNQSLVSLSTQSHTNPKSNEEVIKIPKRIERSPTDVLRALAEVTQRDLSGPDYRYVDDPFLTPLSNYQKRVFSLSRESGRRAAKYVFEEFPELFIRDVSEPKVDAFTYRESYDENTEVEEEDLIRCVARKEVNHSIICYKNLVRDSKPISSESLQKLLELVCFYNCEDPPDFDFVGEKIFIKPSDTPRVIWKDNGFAEQLFNAIEPKTSENYCTLIQGMAKHSQAIKAYEIYQEMTQKGFKLNVETYNSLIKLTPTLKDSTDSRWLFIEEMLNSMKSNDIRPNLRTLNNILEVIVRFATNSRYSQNLVRNVLVEMVNKMGIEPSLATYHFILNIFYKERDPNLSPALYDIMDRIEDQEFIIKDPNDVHFFVNAMNICQSKLNDIQLAHRIHEMVSKPKNYKFLSSVLGESQYFQKYFKLMLAVDDFNKFMDIYQKYVPHVYIPEPSVFSDLFNTIQLYEAYNYVPRLWDDLKQFEYVYNVRLIEEFFSLLSKANVNSEMTKQFSDIVTEAIKMTDEKISNQIRDEVILHYQFPGAMLGYAIDIYIKNNDFEKAVKIVDMFVNQKQKIVGSASPSSFFEVCRSAIEQNKISTANYCIEAFSDLGIYDVIEQVLQLIKESKSLPQNIKTTLEELCTTKLDSLPTSPQPVVTQEFNFIEEENDFNDK